VPRRTRRALMVPPPAVEGFERVESIKALRVTISRRFTAAEHVDNLLAACAQTLFALRTLRQHGLPINALQTVFQATVVANLSYLLGGALPVQLTKRVLNHSSDAQSILVVALTRLRLSPASVPQLMINCSHSSKATPRHLLHPLLPLHEIIITNYGIVPVPSYLLCMSTLANGTNCQLTFQVMGAAIGAAIFSSRIQNCANCSTSCSHCLSYIGQTISNSSSKRSQCNGLFTKRRKQFTNRTQLNYFYTTYVYLFFVCISMVIRVNHRRMSMIDSNLTTRRTYKLVSI
jgi:hypothetical protein